MPTLRQRLLGALAVVHAALVFGCSAPPVPTSSSELRAATDVSNEDDDITTIEPLHESEDAAPDDEKATTTDGEKDEPVVTPPAPPPDPCVTECKGTYGPACSGDPSFCAKTCKQLKPESLACLVVNKSCTKLDWLRCVPQS